MTRTGTLSPRIRADPGLEVGGVGYRVTEEKVSHLQTLWVSESLRTRVHLFTTNVSGLTQEEAPGDGSVWETGSSTRWLSREEALTVEMADFLAAVLLVESMWT